MGECPTFFFLMLNQKTLVNGHGVRMHKERSANLRLLRAIRVFLGNIDRCRPGVLND